MSPPFVVLQRKSTLGTGVKDGSKQLHCWLISNFWKYPSVKSNVIFIAVLHLYHYFIVPLYHHLWKHSWIQAFGLTVSVLALLLPPWQAVESQADRMVIVDHEDRPIPTSFKTALSLLAQAWYNANPTTVLQRKLSHLQAGDKVTCKIKMLHLLQIVSWRVLTCFHKSRNNTNLLSQLKHI